jgi:ubiquinone/menaquinone biosynthesis C-methylase UbiE
MTRSAFDPRKMKERFDRDALGWREKYRWRIHNPFGYNSKAYRKKRALEMLGNGRGVLLDLGCGPGAFFEDLCSHGFFTIGVDFSYEMISLARRVAKGCCSAGVVQADALLLPFRERSFDGLIAVGLLEYLPEDDGMLGEIRRVLKPGGRAILTVRNQRCSERRRWKRYARVFKKSFAEKHYYREHDLQALEEVILGHGFVNVTKRFSHFYPLPWPFSRILRPLNSLLGHAMETLFSRTTVDSLGSVLILKFEAPDQPPGQ